MFIRIFNGPGACLLKYTPQRESTRSVLEHQVRRYSCCSAFWIYAEKSEFVVISDLNTYPVVYIKSNSRVIDLELFFIYYS